MPLKTVVVLAALLLLPSPAPAYRSECPDAAARCPVQVLPEGRGSARPIWPLGRVGPGSPGREQRRPRCDACARGSEVGFNWI